MRFLILLLMFSATAMAEDPVSPDEDRKVVYKQRTEIDFEGVEVEGTLVRPQGSLILARKAGSFNPLIRLRMDFEPELNNSVNLIK
ncbi:MAG TPA: hypothetical protein EYN38_09265 [Flavobacteriales bacterium]|nr:hypothetical protein [Flavobacteriales bacterium]